MKVTTPNQAPIAQAETAAAQTAAATPANTATPPTNAQKPSTLKSSFQMMSAGKSAPAPDKQEAQLKGDPSLFGLPLHGAEDNKTQQGAATASVKTDPAKANTQYLMCPVIGSLIAEGSLKKDDQGNIDLKQLDDLMVHRLGITPERAAVTVSTGFLGNHATDALAVAGGKFNVNHLGGSVLDHQGQGDTGILRGGKFNEDKFQALIAHSKDGKTLTVADFAEAINKQLKRDDGFPTRTKGTSEDLFEMSALINTFGQTDAQGNRSISIDTLRNLYQNRQLPSKEELSARAPTGVNDHVATMGKMGADLAKDTLGAAPPGALSMKMCPFMGKQMGAKKPGEAN